MAFASVRAMEISEPSTRAQSLNFRCPNLWASIGIERGPDAHQYPAPEEIQKPRSEIHTQNGPGTTGSTSKHDLQRQKNHKMSQVKKKRNMGNLANGTTRCRPKPSCRKHQTQREAECTCNPRCAKAIQPQMTAWFLFAIILKMQTFNH